MKNIINKYTAATSVIIGVLITFVFVCLAVPPTPPTVNITGNAATATALASNPTDCGANTVATAIDASGNLTCGQSVGTIATQNADNATITGGNVTGLTNLEADNHTVTSTVNATGATWIGLTVGSVTGAAATADLAEDLSTASHSIYKDSAGNITDIITAIDAHAANTTITLIPGICATIHNSAQGDANAVSTLPALADGLCFTGLVVTTEDDKTFRLNAAAANTICLGATCGKDDIGFATGTVTKGGQFKCLGIGSDWFCHTITGTVDAGDL